MIAGALLVKIFRNLSTDGVSQSVGVIAIKFQYIDVIISCTLKMLIL